MILNNIS